MVIRAGDPWPLSTFPIQILWFYLPHFFRVILIEEVVKEGIGLLLLRALLLLLWFWPPNHSTGGRPWLWCPRIQAAFSCGLSCDASHFIRSIPILQELVENLVFFLQRLVIYISCATRGGNSSMIAARRGWHSRRGGGTGDTSCCIFTLRCGAGPGACCVELICRRGEELQKLLVALCVGNPSVGFSHTQTCLSAGLTVWLVRRALTGGGVWVLLRLLLSTSPQWASWAPGVRVGWEGSFTGSPCCLIGRVDAWGAVGLVRRRRSEWGRHWIAHSLTNGLKGIQWVAGEGGSSSSTSWVTSMSGAHGRVHTYKGHNQSKSTEHTPNKK